jgi:hypothetical protein
MLIKNNDSAKATQLICNLRAPCTKIQLAERLISILESFTDYFTNEGHHYQLFLARLELYFFKQGFKPFGTKAETRVKGCSPNTEPTSATLLATIKSLRIIFGTLRVSVEK